MSEQTTPPTMPAHAPPQKKKGMSTGLKVILIIAGLLVLVCGGGFVGCTVLVGSAANEISKSQAAKAEHVKLTTCEVEKADSDFLPNVKFDIEINNASDSQNTYFIDVIVLDQSGTRVGNTTEVISDVRPGQRAVEEGAILLSQKVSGDITCEIDKVS